MLNLGFIVRFLFVNRAPEDGRDGSRLRDAVLFGAAFRHQNGEPARRLQMRAVLVG